MDPRAKPREIFEPGHDGRAAHTDGRKDLPRCRERILDINGVSQWPAIKRFIRRNARGLRQGKQDGLSLTNGSPETGVDREDQDHDGRSSRRVH